MKDDLRANILIIMVGMITIMALACFYQYKMKELDVELASYSIEIKPKKSTW